LRSIRQDWPNHASGKGRASFQELISVAAAKSDNISQRVLIYNKSRLAPIPHSALPHPRTAGGSLTSTIWPPVFATLENNSVNLGLTLRVKLSFCLRMVGCEFANISRTFCTLFGVIRRLNIWLDASWHRGCEARNRLALNAGQRTHFPFPNQMDGSRFCIGQ
jgi:hypothetical protein